VAPVIRFPSPGQRAVLAAARRLEAAARARHDWVEEHRAEFVRVAREAAADVKLQRYDQSRILP